MKQTIMLEHDHCQLIHIQVRMIDLKQIDMILKIKMYVKLGRIFFQKRIAKNHLEMQKRGSNKHSKQVACWILFCHALVGNATMCRYIIIRQYIDILSEFYINVQLQYSLIASLSVYFGVTIEVTLPIDISSSSSIYFPERFSLKKENIFANRT